ncbi:ThuA domain-containing protein [Catalinimonas sp. 4WD22]|uniref:ThuA domain-containing protein n=1 Tax=Catalinimonas locisalis TaxID=3133978 RepID=UPI003100F29B
MRPYKTSTFSKKLLVTLLALTPILYFSCSNQREGAPKVLVFSKTAAFQHASIPAGVAAIQKLGAENGFEVDTTTNSAMFQEDTLTKYAAVIFLNTTGNVLDYQQEAAFERYIQAGGGYVGIHAASDTEYDWGWYGRLVGGYFNGHPAPQEARFIIKDKNFPATEFFQDTVWTRTDELYNFKKLNPNVNVLITIDESSYEGGTNGDYHPMSWYHDYDGGRAFFTELGHTDESYQEENYLKHLLGGIQYAIGDNNKLDYALAKTQLPPNQDRFTKVQLAQGEFYEPTEMTILPNKDILITQRRGEILRYKHDTQEVKQVGFLDVYYKTSVPRVNAEEGVLGITKDPDFENNHWIYIYYSPSDTSVNRLSRFTYENDTIDKATEKVILDVKSQREICCHTGGSLAFGPDGLLFLSTGDNSTPFNEPDEPYVNNGYAPLNDAPGHEQYDARRSSGNTNDLRGKILRIKVNEDGSYDIPEGNLFPEGNDKTRPEIYVMGNRNPYRIAVDQKNGYLYWGEVGPDARQDSLKTRGPKGYDEVNQAREAGFFGWPLFVGNNYAYHEYNYENGEASPQAFDPNKPVNNSRNNTGLTELPKANPAFIWYPYDASADFPQVGTGGRNAMAGPVYYTDMFPEDTRLPDYYNGKLIIYDWIRGWIKAVTLQENGDFDKMEPFFEDIDVNSLIDMEVGPDGQLYLLEYGSGWFSKNEDAGLARIDFNAGNLPPKINDFIVNETSGSLPFEITAQVEAQDPEKQRITYVWDLGNGETKTTTTPELTYIYSKPGDYDISVEVKDEGEASSKSTPVSLYAGNTKPDVAIEVTKGNRSFYIPGVPFEYAVKVADPEDGDEIVTDNLMVSMDYVQGYDKAEDDMGHQEGAALIEGKNLVSNLDCKSCHKENEASIGPSYMKVSEKYRDDPEATNYLVHKIINGGGGVWGETQMAAHPDLAEADATQIVSWILSLSGEVERAPSLPANGTITPEGGNPEAALVIMASYTDQGGQNIKSLTQGASLALPSNRISFSGSEMVEGFSPMTFNSNHILVYPENAGWFALESVDLSNVTSINVMSGWQEAPSAGLSFELRLDGPEGKVIGTGKMAAPKPGQQGGAIVINIDPVTDNKFHDLYFVYQPDAAQGAMQAGVMGIQFNGD